MYFAIMLEVIACSPSKKIENDNFSGRFEGKFIYMIINNDGTFDVDERIAYKADVVTIFDRGYSTGKWQYVKGGVVLNSESPHLKAEIINTTSNYKVNNKSVNLNVNLKIDNYQDFEFFLCKDNFCKRFESNRKLDSITFGEYYLKVKPVKSLLEDRMVINIDSIMSNKFIIAENDRESEIKITIDGKVFSYLKFSDFFVKIINPKKIIYKGNQLKKVN